MRIRDQNCRAPTMRARYINSHALNERHRNNYTLTLLSLAPSRNRRKVNAYIINSHLDGKPFRTMLYNNIILSLCSCQNIFSTKPDLIDTDSRLVWKVIRINGNWRIRCIRRTVHKHGQYTVFQYGFSRHRDAADTKYWLNYYFRRRKYWATKNSSTITLDLAYKLAYVVIKYTLLLQ